MIKPLIRKEFLQIRRNAFLPRLILMFPIVIMCVIPWVMDMEVRNIGVVVIDNDHSTASCRLVHEIEHSDYFIFKGLRGNEQEAMADIEDCVADLALTIPNDYEKRTVRGERPQIQIVANAVNGTKGGIGASYLANIANGDLMSAVSELYLYNKHLNYKVFMIPALMSILMMLMCGFLPALNIVSEKECGTIEQMNVTPVSRTEFIMAKLIPYWLIGIAVLTICFVLSWLVYGITSAGSLPLLYLISILLALVFSGMGLIISNYSDTMQQAIFVMWFFVVCMMLLSGLFTPVRSMPGWAQLITLIDPVRYYIEAMRTVFVRGGGINDVSTQLISLAIMATAMSIWAIASYRKRN